MLSSTRRGSVLGGASTPPCFTADLFPQLPVALLLICNPLLPHALLSLQCSLWPSSSLPTIPLPSQPPCLVLTAVPRFWAFALSRTTANTRLLRRRGAAPSSCAPAHPPSRVTIKSGRNQTTNLSVCSTPQYERAPPSAFLPSSGNVSRPPNTHTHQRLRSSIFASPCRLVSAVKMLPHWQGLSPSHFLPHF